MAAIRNRIYIGSLADPDYYFENDSIISANVVQNVALVGTELSIDSFTPVVIDDENNLHDIYHFQSSDGHEIMDSVGEIFCIDVGESTNVSPMIMISHGTPIWYYQEDTLIGKFYITSVDRVGRNKYQLNAVSAIGLLDEMENSGKLFEAPATFGEVLSHILASSIYGSGDPVIEYTIDKDVEDLPVSGWLPHDTKRNNLYQLMFANGVNIVKNMNGDPHFTFLYSGSDVASEIHEEQIYDQGSVSYESPYIRVVVNEHTYTPILSADTVTLFDNTEGSQVSNVTVWFSEAPIIQSTITATSGLQIVDSSENYAIVSGTGKLTGIPYLHDTRAVNKWKGDA